MSKSREHLESVNESYFAHLGQATHFGTSMIIAGFACLIHGLLPGTFTQTGSKAISQLNDSMIKHRNKSAANNVSG